MAITEIIVPLIGILIVVLFLVGFLRVKTLYKNCSRNMRAPCPSCGAKGIEGEQSGKVFLFLCSFCGHTWFNPM
jgi:hypothetical protein